MQGFRRVQSASVYVKGDHLRFYVFYFVHENDVLDFKEHVFLALGNISVFPYFRSFIAIYILLFFGVCVLTMLSSVPLQKHTFQIKWCIEVF